MIQQTTAIFVNNIDETQHAMNIIINYNFIHLTTMFDYVQCVLKIFSEVITASTMVSNNDKKNILR